MSDKQHVIDKEQDLIRSLGITGTLPSNCANAVATGLLKKQPTTKELQNLKYDNGYYPYTFLSVNLVMDSGLTLRNLAKWVSWQNKHLKPALLNVHEVKQYEILDNTLGGSPMSDIHAKVISIEAKQTKAGELGRTLM